LVFLHFHADAQMKIGDNPTSINSASLLELETTNKGLVFPRLSLTSVSSSSPLPAGLLTGTVVYNTNSSVTNGNGIGLYSWNGSAWVSVTPSISAAAWGLTGNAGTSASTNFIGTTDAIDFVAKTNNLERLRITSGGNVGIGLTNPSYALSVLSASNPLYLSGVQATSTLSSDSVVTINAGIIKKTPYSSFTNAFWGLTGNAGTNATTNFIGTTDAIDFVTKTNKTDRVHILGAANVSSKEGWIGMGISIPRSSLDVTGNYTNKNVITVQNTSSSGYSSVDMLDNTGTLVGTFGYGNSGTGSFFGSRDYFSFYGHDFVLNTNSGNYDLFVAGSTGNIGIGTSSPATKLDVNGGFKLGSSGTVLTKVIKGTGSLLAFSISGIGTTTTKTITVTGASTGASVTINPQSSLPGGLAIAYCYVSSANTLTIGFVSTLLSISIPAITFDITIIQ